jgi:hypothetical protein
MVKKRLLWADALRITAIYWLFRTVISASMYADLRMIPHESALRTIGCEHISLGNFVRHSHRAGFCPSGAMVCPLCLAPARCSRGYGMVKTHWFLCTFMRFFSENSMKSDRNSTTEKSVYLVLIKHISNEPAKFSPDQIGVFISIAIATTCVPLFVMLSGALLLNTKDENYKTLFIFTQAPIKVYLLFLAHSGKLFPLSGSSRSSPASISSHPLPEFSSNLPNYVTSSSLFLFGFWLSHSSARG